jgi:hypothetical protein
MANTKKMPRSIIHCKECLDVIESFHRHDFKRCKCEAIFIDGGRDYQRRGGRLESIFVVETPTAVEQPFKSEAHTLKRGSRLAVQGEAFRLLAEKAVKAELSEAESLFTSHSASFGRQQEKE